MACGKFNNVLHRHTATHFQGVSKHQRDFKSNSLCAEHGAEWSFLYEQQLPIAALIQSSSAKLFNTARCLRHHLQLLFQPHRSRDVGEKLDEGEKFLN